MTDDLDTRVPAPLANLGDLLQRLGHGDISIWPQVIDAARPIIRQAIRASVHAPSEWEDIEQDVLMRLPLSALTFDSHRADSNARCRAWLYRVASNRARNHLRSTTRRRQREQQTTDTRTLTPDLDQLAAVCSLLNQLSEADRHILLLAYVAELDHQELAKELACQPATARKRLERARKRARTLAERLGIVALVLLLFRPQRLDALETEGLTDIAPRATQNLQRVKQSRQSRQSKQSRQHCTDKSGLTKASRLMIVLLIFAGMFVLSSPTVDNQLQTAIPVHHAKQQGHSDAPAKPPRMENSKATPIAHTWPPSNLTQMHRALLKRAAPARPGQTLGRFCKELNRIAKTPGLLHTPAALAHLPMPATRSDDTVGSLLRRTTQTHQLDIRITHGRMRLQANRH